MTLPHLIERCESGEFELASASVRPEPCEVEKLCAELHEIADDGDISVADGNVICRAVAMLNQLHGENASSVETESLVAELRTENQRLRGRVAQLEHEIERSSPSDPVGPQW